MLRNHPRFKRYPQHQTYYDMQSVFRQFIIVSGESIVFNPDDAVNCFLGTDIEALLMGNILLMKQDVPGQMKIDYKNSFSLD